MADTDQNKRAAGSDQLKEQSVGQQKRKNEDDSEKECSNKIIKTSAGTNAAGPFRMAVAGKADRPSIGNGKQTAVGVTPIKMSLSASSKIKDKAPLKPQVKVASVFGDSDSEEEEMPVEAKMRMRNVGRETPTAAGPNSFGKGNLGFCDRTKMIERDLKRQMDEFTQKQDGKG